MHLFLVEDDPTMRSTLERALTRRGLRVSTCDHGALAVGKWQAMQPEVVVLDLSLPGLDGLQVLEQARRAGLDTPVLILTARGTVGDRVLGLNAGADDYLAKPFDLDELEARIRALGRRRGASAAEATPEHIQIGALIFDKPSGAFHHAGQVLELTPREFDLLFFFARQPGKVFSRMDLLNAVWGYQHEGYEHTVNTHINRLRAKVEADPANPRRILTVWGRGYKFAEPGGPA